ARVRGASGIWKELTDNVNLMGSNLTDQVRDIAEVTTAVATGDLSRKITVEVRGEILELKNTINVMVDQLRSFADEVTRVAREVGTEGVLGGQAEVRGVSGTWRELTDNVNFMARNLTAQVRGIARLVTAVARGDLDQELRLDARGEIAELVETINGMTGTLSVFAEQVTGVARDVGVEGKLGGQADVPGAAGVWSDLVSNVNELAGNLTRQVRAIGDVATAVTKGDLSRSITVEARGEVALLKDNINQMIHTLAETTRVNQEQDWLKTNLARFTRMLQGQRDLITVAQLVLSELASLVNAQHGVFYMADKDAGEVGLQMFASYAFVERKSSKNKFRLGEGLVGQAALEKKRITVTQAPSDYVQIGSGLGAATPQSIVVVPVLFESDVKGVIELASFERFTPIQLAFLEQLLESLGIVVATIEATMRTDGLLRQSQRLTEELQLQQEELQQTNEELEEKAHQLSEQKAEVERKNREVETAKRELEEKAEQLALTSRYKNEFLANMSHELRTPLNSLLILSRQLSDNIDRNLSEKQVRYAQTIHQSGADLLALINEILDLAKIESGTMAVELSPVRLSELSDYVERTFRHLAVEKELELTTELVEGAPETIETDDMRLRQILRNLLSNAIKFTERGSVSLRMCAARDVANKPSSVGEDQIAFLVRDSGIGIPRDKQRIIFEAFQQADGSTSRKYGGTGLGLSISRELTALLGGELVVESEPGKGSTFTLFLPRRAPESGRRFASLRDTPLPSEPKALPLPVITTWRESVAQIQDDRANIRPGDRVLLIVEDDAPFAELLLGMARDRGFRGVVCMRGQEALDVARSLRPDAITLDLRLPDVDGWVLLDQLKHGAETRHIPVHVISALEGERRALENGAFAVLHKPVTQEAVQGALNSLAGFLERRVRQLLVIEDDAVQRQSIVELIGDGDVVTTAVGSGEEAIELIKQQSFDCIVVDLRLPGVSGVDLIGHLKQLPNSARTPIIVYTGRELTRAEDAELNRVAQSVIVKDVRSPERLLEETALFLHRVEADLPEDKRDLLRRVAQMDPLLSDKRVLLVDDDLRNIFALTALLEQHKMRVLSAENGREALELLEREAVDIVLMDIMMPEMDGYEAIRRIRKNSKHAQLPVIALTAKAMAGDRDACIKAGASDYITKPVELSQLLSLLRVWLYGRGAA
ncbi:MAG TPA: response regulator, partial [Polyangiales bacterium]